VEEKAKALFYLQLQKNYVKNSCIKMKSLDPVKIKSEIYTIKAKLILKFQWL
jgi:hypothetical protein